MIVPLITLFVRLVIIIFVAICASLRKSDSTPSGTSPPTVVVVGGDGSEPPREVKEPPPDDGSHDASSPALPPYEVKKPLPDFGSHDVPASTLQTPTLPMKIYVCTFWFRAYVAFVVGSFVSCAQRPNDSSPSTMYPECQEGPSPRAPDASYQSSFSLYKLTNIPATEQGEHHGLSMV